MSVTPKDTEDSVAELLAEVAALRAERDRIAAALASTTQQRDTAEKQRDTATLQAKAAEQRADRLKLQIKRLAYLLYGRRSEKLSAEETAQLVLSFGGTDEQAAVVDPEVPVPPPLEEELEPEDASEPEKPRKKRKHPGRSKLSPSLKRIVTEIPVPEAERACKCCGTEMTAITPLEHERVEHVPETLVVHVERREVLVC
jgi:chromosome segregation ATPase